KVAKAIWLEHEMRKPASLGAGRCKGLIALVQTTLLKGGYDFYPKSTRKRRFSRLFLVLF
ncbi:hypothetical protein, partial [Enterococcus canintestini]